MNVAARAALTGVVAAGLLWPVPTAAATGACSGVAAQRTLETIVVESLDVELRAARRRYAPGDVARVRVTVTRPAGSDPAGPGELVDPPASVPAAGVEVGLGVSIGDEYAYGYGVTGDRGITTAKVRIPADAPRKAAHVRALASKRYVNTICANVDEVGFASKRRLFRVVR